MKITFIIAGLSIKSGGPTHDIKNLTSRLAARSDFKISVITSDSPDRVLLPSSVTVLLCSKPWEAPWEFGHVCRSVVRTLKDSDCVFVWGVWGWLEGALFRLLRVRDLPYAYKAVGMLEPYIVNHNRWRKRLALFCYVRSNLRDANMVLVDSDRESSSVKNVGLVREVCIFRVGVDSSYPLAAHCDGYTLVYLGRIVRKKGLDFFLPVLAKLKASFPRIKLIVAGDYDDVRYKVEIDSIVRNFGLLDHVEFKGQVTGEQKYALLAQGNCFVLPSLSEGFSNAVVESLAAGTPVFITPECNFEEVAAAHLGAVIPRDQDAWVAKLEQFLRGDIKLRTPQELRDYVVEHYSWDVAVEGLISIAKRIQKKRPCMP